MWMDFLTLLIAVALTQYSTIKHLLLISSWERHLSPLKAAVTSRQPLGNSPARIYVGEMGYNCLWYYKTFLAKALAAHGASVGPS